MRAQRREGGQYLPDVVGVFVAVSVVSVGVMEAATLVAPPSGRSARIIDYKH